MTRVRVISKVDDGLRREVLAGLGQYVHAANVLLEKERLDLQIWAVDCPQCNDTEHRHRVMLPLVDLSLSVYCTGCGASWSDRELGWLGRLQAV